VTRSWGGRGRVKKRESWNGKRKEINNIVKGELGPHNAESTVEFAIGVRPVMLELGPRDGEVILHHKAFRMGARHNVVLVASSELDDKGVLLMHIFRLLSFEIKGTLQIVTQWPPGYPPTPQGPSRPQKSSSLAE
jgi:hypothetical protein